SLPPPPSDQTFTQDFLEDDPSLSNAVDVTEFGTGYRPLHYAAYGGFLGVCEALHTAGARPLAAGDNGVTALFLAAQAGKVDVVRFLLGLGADPTARERESGLCAMDVASESDPDVFRQMQEKGGFEVPPAPEVPPTVNRVEPTSLQVAYLPFPEASGQLPVTRYKVKVEHPGDSSNQATQAPDITDAANINNASNNTTTSNIPLDVDGAEGAEDARAPPAADPDAGGDDSSFADPTLSKVVLVPSAGETNSASEGGRQKRTLVTVRGLRPATRYRVKVAAINALGFGPYGPPSEAVLLPEKLEGDGEGEGSSTTRENGSSVGAERAKKGKGRQVLAREKRRSMAAQAARLQEQQLLEAKERQQRRRAQSQGQQQGSTDAKVSGRQQLAAMAGGDYCGRHNGGVGAGGDGRERPLTESSGVHHHHRSRSQPKHGGAELAARAARTTTAPAQRGAEPPPPTATATAAAVPAAKAGHRGAAPGRRRRQADERSRRGRAERPVTTTTTTTTGAAAAERRDRDDGSDGPPGRRRLIATAPLPTADTTEPPRYLAATSAGRMSARAYSQRTDGGGGGGDGTVEEWRRERIAGINVRENRPLRGSPSPRVDDKKGSGGSKSKRFGGGAGSGAGEGARAGRGAGGRRRRGQPAAGGGGRGGCLSSDVSISSCGDMTISSEEQDGEEMAYTG
ncbi:unnamed protein product, partial [Ectocarpus sp. 12 AP-2014]